MSSENLNNISIKDLEKKLKEQDEEIKKLEPKKKRNFFEDYKKNQKKN